jgi:hypothetical protein
MFVLDPKKKMSERKYTQNIVLDIIKIENVMKGWQPTTSSEVL